MPKRNSRKSKQKNVTKALSWLIILCLGALIGYAFAKDLGIEVPFDPVNPSYPPSSGSDTFLTGIGGDYLVYFNDLSTDRNPAIWETNWIQNDLSYFAQQGLTCSRLGFSFESNTDRIYGSCSVYQTWKMKQVVGYFEEKGMTVILSYQNNYDNRGFAGSDDWFSGWLGVAQDFKNDDTVVAYNIFGEPEHDVGGYDTWDSSINTKQEFLDRMMELTRAIHQIDPEKIVILPYMGLGSLYYGWKTGSLYSEWIQDLKDAGFKSEPNTVVDIIHPYYFENSYDFGLTVDEKVQWYETYQIKPMIEAFGSDRCWAGETFSWYGTSLRPGDGTGGNPTTYSIQDYWLEQIINCYVSNDVDFDVWAYWSTTAVHKSATKQSMVNSNWN